MKKLLLSLFILSSILFGCILPVSGSAIEPAVQEKDYGLGKNDSAPDTLFGGFKKCSQDGFFYVILVNNENRDITVTLPRRVKADNNYYDVNNAAYLYKELDPANWDIMQFADAINGSPLTPSSSNNVTLPAGKVWSVMGKIEKLSQYLLTVKPNSIDSFSAEAIFLFDGAAITAAGEFEKEGNLCDVIGPSSFDGSRDIKGAYLIDQTGKEVCSIAYYIKVANPDKRYSITVELPRFIELNGDRRYVGCEFLDDTCTVSGFRHYAWAEEDPSGKIWDNNFVFCDKDTAKGDLCYENDLWWMTIPAGKTFLIRSMVNHLCDTKNGELENPLTGEYVDFNIILNDLGNYPHPIKGQVFGTPRTGAPSSGSSGSGNSGTGSSGSGTGNPPVYIEDQPINFYWL